MTTSTRNSQSVEIPATGEWAIDQSHAELAFIGRHFGLTKVRGRFTGVSGIVSIAKEIERSSVVVEIDMTSVSSGDQARDDHLRSADFFDVAEHPYATFESKDLRITGAAGQISGDLTIKGISRSVTLDVEFLGQTTDPWGNERAVFSASTKINREDWGLTWNVVLDAGGLLVSKEIRIEIEVEVIRQQA